MGQAPIFRHPSSLRIISFLAEKSEPDPSAVKAYQNLRVPTMQQATSVEVARSYDIDLSNELQRVEPSF